MGTGIFIPPLIDPNELTCVKFLMPNDPLYRQVVRGHLYQLGNGYYWGDSEDERAQDVSQLFLVNLLDSLEIGANCGDEEEEGGLGQCFRMDTTTDIFSFYPNDPFTDGANAQGNKILSSLKWIRWGDADLFNMPIIGDVAEDIVNAVVQYFPNDIIVALDFIEILNPIARFQDLIEQVTNFPLPYVRIELEGTGQVEIEVLNMPFGGVVMIVPDLPVDENLIPDIQGTIDTLIGFFDDGLDLPKGWVSLFLDRDITKLDLVPTQIQEFEFDEGGTHTLHAFFCPILTPDPPFVNPFGGIREIEFCGNITVLGATTGNLIDIKNYGLEQHRRQGLIMATKDEICEGVICALETISGRIVSGQADNIKNAIEIGTGGGITVKSGGGTAPIEQPNANNQAIYYGGVLNQAQQIQQIFSNVATMEANGFSDENIARLAFAENNILNFAEWTTKLIDYANGSLSVSIDIQKLARLFYCEGYDNAIIEYGINELTEPEADIFIFIANNITVATRDSWFNVGQSSPNEGYKQSSCYRFPVIKATFDNSIVGNKALLFGENTWSGNRKFLVEYSGVLTAPNGDTYDGMYWEYDNGNNPFYGPARLISATDANGSNSEFPPPDTLLSLKQDKSDLYQAEYTISGASNRRLYSIGIDGNFANLRPLSGSLEIKVYDRGSV